MIWKRKPDLAFLQSIGKNTMTDNLGIEYVEMGDDFITAKMPVDHRTVQPFRILHGGASVALAEVMVQYIGGLRASMGYCGARTIEEMHNAQFVRITGAGIIESHPHNITITKESPNYSR